MRAINKLLVQIVFFFVLGGAELFSQSTVVANIIENKKADYASITSLVVSTPYYYKPIKSDNNAGYKYRAIITTSEIYTELYVEKIKLDVEGGIVDIEWSKKINTRSILDSYGMSSETSQISGIIWKDENSFTFFMGSRKLLGRIINSDKIEISKVQIE